MMMLMMMVSMVLMMIIFSISVEMQYLLNLLKPKYIICENEKAQEINNNLKQINLDCKIIVLDTKVRKIFFYKILSRGGIKLVTSQKNVMIFLGIGFEFLFYERRIN